LERNRRRTDIEEDERECSDSRFERPWNLAIRLVTLDRIGVLSSSGNFIASITRRDVFDLILGDISLFEIRIHVVDLVSASDSEFETHKGVVTYTLSPLLNRSLMILDYEQCRLGYQGWEYTPRLDFIVSTKKHTSPLDSTLKTHPKCVKPPTGGR
jgi:hypothetical protein